MKTSHIILSLFFLSSLVSAQVAQVESKAQITNVTVYLDKAQIANRVNCAIGAGVTEIVVKNLPQELYPKSIQVTGKGDYILLGVQHQMNYLNANAHSASIQTLEDSIESITDKINLLSQLKEVLTQEEKMILSNQSLKGNDATLKALELEDMADFYRERLTNIRQKQLYDSRQIERLQKELYKYQAQLNIARSEFNKPSSDVIIKVSSKIAQTAQLNLEYITGNARWYPVYDLRVKEQAKDIQLVYKAQVVQETGLNWDNVKLKLSTTNPSVDGTKPSLEKWNLEFYVPISYFYKDAKMKKLGSVERAASMDEVEEMPMMNAAASTSSDYTTVVETSLFAEFDIAIPYTVNSNPQGQLVDVQNYNLPVGFRHGAVPKLSTSCYLMADITGWESLALLPGTAQLYYQNNYVGESYLDPVNFSDTLSLSLGADPKVLIEREQIKDFTSKKFIGSNRKEEYAYRIKIRNTKKEAITLKVEEQIPVSTNNQIEVVLIDAGGAAHEIETGKLTWDLNVGPSETKELVFKFSVKYPKGKVISNL
jgi:uncharacterized protein (TIGR02231 family)